MIRLTRDGDQYRYDGARASYTIAKFQSDYGDTQWVCDIAHHDGRTMDRAYWQTDYLSDIRRNIAIAEGETR